MKFYKICKQLYKVCRICQQLFEVFRICQQIWEVQGICKQLLWSLQKLQRNLQSSLYSPITFGKSLRPANWKVGFKCLKVFLYLSFTCLNILIGKNKCFVKTFHVSWILFRSQLNRGCYMRVDKIFGAVKKWLSVALDMWSFCAV